MRAGMQMRVAFIALIYRKLLTLSTSHTASGGFIVNMVSNDVQRFEDASPFAHYVWLGPIEALLATYFMYVQIGYGAFTAVGFLFMLIPLQSALAKVFGKLRRRSVLLRDERIRNIADMLTGIMVIKLYAWENPFKARIHKLRDEELSIIKTTARYRAMNDAFWFSSGGYLNLTPFTVSYGFCIWVHTILFIWWSFHASSCFYYDHTIEWNQTFNDKFHAKSVPILRRIGRFIRTNTEIFVTSRS